MSDSLNPNQVRKYLTAFADGELDVEQSLKVLEQLAMDPGTTRRVIHQQQLRKAVARCLADPAQCPAGVRERVAAALEAAAAAEPPAGSVGAERPWHLRPLGRWAPLGVAAALVIGTMVLLLESGRGGGGPLLPAAGGTAPRGYAVVPAGESLLSPEQIAAFSQRHVRCANALAELFRKDEFPKEVQALPAAVSKHVGSKVDCRLDLSRIGYRYDVAGVCTLPGKGSVHILYRAAPESGHADRVSLWVRVADDQAPRLDPERVYVVADPSQPHPMLMWREDNLVFYLMGDAGERVQLAADRLRRHGGEP